VTLGKLEGGAYGVCEVCGRKIPAKRLEALPDANRCVACEEKSRTR
jgi:RNA polymerase-binding transcription factor DksA